MTNYVQRVDQLDRIGVDMSDQQHQIAMRERAGLPVKRVGLGPAMVEAKRMTLERKRLLAVYLPKALLQRNLDELRLAHGDDELDFMIGVRRLLETVEARVPLSELLAGYGRPDVDGEAGPE